MILVALGRFGCFEGQGSNHAVTSNISLISTLLISAARVTATIRTTRRRVASVFLIRMKMLGLIEASKFHDETSKR